MLRVDWASARRTMDNAAAVDEGREGLTSEEDSPGDDGRRS